MKERKILCPDPVEDQEEAALAAAVAEVDSEEVAEAASEAASADREGRIITDRVTITTAPSSEDIAAPITVAAVLADFSE